MKSNPHIVAPTENPRVVRAVEPPQDRVGIVTGGGSGHKPAFVGYVGKNMVDAVAVGEIFSSPTAAAFLDAFRAANAGKGVACLYGKRMCDIVLPDLPFQAGDEVAVLVSGLGATPVMELYVLYNEIDKLLAERGIKVYRSYVGNYFTSLEMSGATFSAMKLDDELKPLLDMPVETMGLKQF